MVVYLLDIHALTYFCSLKESSLMALEIEEQVKTPNI